MKTKAFNVILFLAAFTTTVVAQDFSSNRIPLIGENALGFTAESTLGIINFPQDYFGKWKIIFSHPADFTPVCSSEILELSKLYENFSKLNTAILVLSTDGINSHIEWVKSLEEIEYKNSPKTKVGFPLIADEHLEISKKYGMIHPSYSDKKDIRGVFIIDPDNKVRAIFFYPATIGRNFAEIERALLALQHADKESLYTPANWKPGDDYMLPAPSSITEAEKLAKKNDPRYYSYAWYMWFRKAKIN